MDKPFLICFSGLPGVGKTTIAEQLSKTMRAVFLRVDTIEKLIIETFNQSDIGPIGYDIMARIACDNIRLGSTVILGCVNPLKISRQIFHNMASQLSVPIFDIEVQCHDKCEHKNRIENRKNSSLKWKDILNFAYENWDRDHLTIDSFQKTPQDNVAIIINYIKNQLHTKP